MRAIALPLLALALAACPDPEPLPDVIGLTRITGATWTDPENRLLPLLDTTVMLPPEPRPLTAGARPELTRNSATDSIDVCSRNCEPVAFR